MEILFSRAEPVDASQSNDQEFMYAAVSVRLLASGRWHSTWLNSQSTTSVI